MNSKNGIIAAIVVLVLLFLGYMFWNSSQVVPTAGEPVATSTPTDGTPVTAVPPTPSESAGLPGIQTGLLVVPSNVSAVVTGYVAPNGAATTYWFDYGSANSLTKRTATKSAGAGFVTLATPAFIDGLAANTTYSYRLNAQNSFGSVQGATYTFTTTTNPPPAGSTPVVSTSAAVAIARTAATLSGTVNPSSAQTTYWFEYGPTQSFGSVSAFGAAGDGASPLTVSAPVVSLAAQTKYYYRLNAQNNFGTISGATQSFTTLGPVASGLPTVNTTAATNVSTSTATLGGRANPHNAASKYWFEYGTSPLLADILGIVSATQTLPAEVTTAVSGSVKGLSSNTKYYYRLVVRNPQGTVVGDIFSFTTKR
jgi:phosphodiesterase/alkaline phosphatase D-like protein